jgi:carboxyl-terminal processing protease
LPYDGLLKVTTGKYYIPSGRLIQAIDYSHRNPDGSVARIPDSLTNVFHTIHGRVVRDGGGITPDVASEYSQLNRLTYNIVRDNWAFDYATRFAANNTSIAPAREFHISDSIFADFKAFIDPQKFKYDKVCETMLQNLREAATSEGYMNDSVASQLSVLEELLKHDLNHDLDQNRKTIDMLLSDEIVKRYYYQRGHVENYLQWDSAIDTAIVVLNDKERYKRILTPALNK